MNLNKLLMRHDKGDMNKKETAKLIMSLVELMNEQAETINFYGEQMAKLRINALKDATLIASSHELIETLKDEVCRVLSDATGMDYSFEEELH